MMKRKIIIAVGVTMLLGILPTWAQPKARAAQEENKSANELSVRAQTRYPGSKSLPQDVVSYIGYDERRERSTLLSGRTNGRQNESFLVDF